LIHASTVTAELGCNFVVSATRISEAAVFVPEVVIEVAKSPVNKGAVPSVTDEPTAPLRLFPEESNAVVLLLLRR